MEGGGFGTADKLDFWITERAVRHWHPRRVRGRPATVDAFHAAASSGGRDNGAPGIRAMYHPTYYGAFVLDADGNNVEAVCHKPA